MFSKIAEIGSVFDWITPIVQTLQDLGGMTTIDATVGGWTGNEVKRALERAGVRCGAGMLVSGRLLLPVDDERRAEAVLADLRAGYGAARVRVRVPGPQARAPRHLAVGAGRCPYCGTIRLRGSVKCPQCGGPY